MNLSKIFIERPVATTILVLAIVIFGLIAFRALPVSELPNVDFPTIRVDTELRGANPEVMASTVATPLERQFSQIAGLERPTSGRVVVAGRNFADMNEDDLALFRRDHVGIVFQSFHLVPTMTALENVAIPLELAGRRDAFALAQERLEAVGLGHRLLHYPG